MTSEAPSALSRSAFSAVAVLAKARAPKTRANCSANTETPPEPCEERTRDRVPLDWAMTQNNLGTALSRLGERENGTVRLEQAVAAYQTALEETTRDRVPLQWATTQNNL